MLCAVPWGTALLSFKLMAKHRLASMAAGWALPRDLMQNRKEMESSGLSREAICLPIHLRVLYVFLLSPFQISLWVLLPPRRAEPCGSWGHFEAPEFF